ncbi:MULTISPECIES: glycosyltransferase family 4 protein [Cyanophyceae]|uniref:glycosyltransferase family 4 protein n=1 Tax=Cyanophyceae TaxID=3028117 RepID=UPI00016DC8E6|nr:MULTISPECIES: glycosyltransferase family 4 protein [Cyanophyceae]ACA99505.1 putative glycosyltransferase, group 1 family protein [Picosynechococcus sp. PCC 7002]SMH30242.1 Glycosyltransferase involved in cell wall bisynthesis [Picosynechococcus sp. OG1]SMQ83866.1 Glycosyltransferase involved in cell wall bisynthesis [Synechococcus sp. 7002]
MRSSLWICCQIGAREHYAIARSLHRHQNLACLITDTWVPPQSLLQSIPSSSLKSLKERFHPDLATAAIHHNTLQSLRFELTQRVQKTDPWSRIMARNVWFQRYTCTQLSGFEICGTSKPILFAYSYAALDLLKFAKSKGWYTVLGQIDPGMVEADIVQQEHQRYPHLAPQHAVPPAEYWSQWQEECRLTDQIMVNSTWSKQALLSIGIPDSKLQVVPLAYEPPESSHAFERTYPDRFTAERPLRVLFLGQVILRKGIAAIIEAAQKLSDRPIEFWIVGGLGIIPPPDTPKNLHWIGSVPRSQVTTYYQDADLFLFPTLSDGFGLTQLEAQAWKLPIIASRFCGEVVKDQTNGLLLPEVSGEAIANALVTCLQQPKCLQYWSDNAVDLCDFSLNQLHHRLQTLFL